MENSKVSKNEKVSGSDPEKPLEDWISVERRLHEERVREKAELLDLKYLQEYEQISGKFAAKTFNLEHQFLADEFRKNNEGMQDLVDKLQDQIEIYKERIQVAEKIPALN